MGTYRNAEAGPPRQTLEDALAQRVEARREPVPGWARWLRELGALDRAVYGAVVHTPTATLDGPLRWLSNAASYSRLWVAAAAVIAAAGGKNGRRAALEGLLAIGVTSATVNLIIKPLARRRRPRRAGAALSGARRVAMPESASFPSGHAAAAFAFAYAIGRHLPQLAVPIRLLAGAVAYSRVHTGVHYPGDVVIGAIHGAGTAAMVAAACDRLSQLLELR